MPIQIEGFDRSELEFYRKVFLPRIVSGVITGYNVYREDISYEEPFVINYLHSKLRPEDEHRKELLDEIKRQFNPLVIERIVDRVVDRTANYKSERRWVMPRTENIYDKNGRQLSLEELDSYDGPIIKERLEYDLAIKIVDEKELKELLTLLREKCYKYSIDEDGEFVYINNEKVPNPRRIRDEPWEIPLITVTNRKPVELKGFSKIRKYQFKNSKNGFKSLTSLFTGSNTARFNSTVATDFTLSSMKEFDIELLANNLFVKEYLN